MKTRAASESNDKRAEKRDRLKREEEEEQRAESRHFQKRPKAGAADDWDADVGF